METLIVERDGGVATVTMNRPHRKNAATATMLRELRACFEEVEQRPEDRVLVLTGAGGDFCSGADLGDPDSPAPAGGVPAVVSMRRLGDVALALHRLTKPTIARVDGVAVGAGLSLALGCDLVVASDRARLSMIFSRRALALDAGASWLLPRLVGMARAKEVALFGDLLDAERALALGLVNRVVPAGQLAAFVDGWARSLANGPTLALSLTKTLLNNSWSSSLGEAVEDEARCQAVNFTSADTAEALAAFGQKREPRFIGR
ncbi:MAG: enoyl-CoA hydratase/isomerase family protein [Acidimicrobiales bacterium]